jgi:hypothetical protein
MKEGEEARLDSIFIVLRESSGSGAVTQGMKPWSMDNWIFDEWKVGRK